MVEFLQKKLGHEKLILLKIFSYSCMNCLRSFAFIRKINDKYRKYGLITVIVHPPEWKFEKKKSNVLCALKKYNIRIPIIIDRNKKVIEKLGIDFWPAQILLKTNFPPLIERWKFRCGKTKAKPMKGKNAKPINGTFVKIAYKHIGEGNYKELENKIIKLLKINPDKVFKKVFRKEPSYSKFPSVYCGKRKNGKIKLLGQKIKLKFNVIYTDKNWIQRQEYIKSVADKASLEIASKGRIINFVAESLLQKKIKVDVKVNNYIKTIMVGKPRLYTLIELKSSKLNKLRLISDPNLAIYSFSFQ
ncbi:hypothetical protein HYX01_04325 [Candidatus Woesearchaeota archaeon]|nr:hypothetical protein [Candidatus Woesearchaeota archaeon]